MRFGIEIEREVDGRWIGAVVEMPGAQAEFPRGPLSVEFEISPAGA